MNSQPASRAASQAARYCLQVDPFKASVARRPREDSTSRKRQKPTRIPYSCQHQFGTSGSSGCPIGGDRMVRGIGSCGSQFSMLTMVHTAMRASLGSTSGRRRVIGSYGTLWGAKRAPPDGLALCSLIWILLDEPDPGTVSAPGHLLLYFHYVEVDATILWLSCRQACCNHTGRSLSSGIADHFLPLYGSQKCLLQRRRVRKQ